ncbi:MAG: hypothetical protein QXT13_12270 [Pyrobaculum sp.]
MLAEAGEVGEWESGFLTVHVEALQQQRVHVVVNKPCIWNISAMPLAI